MAEAIEAELVEPDDLTHGALVPATPVDPRRHPALRYLARLGSERSRETMRQALETIAALLSDGRATALTLPWHLVRYEHTAEARARLLARRRAGDPDRPRYAAATVNKHLCALRGVLKECWRLGSLTEDERRRAADLEPVRGDRLPAGRALARRELQALLAACDADAADPAGARDAALLAVLAGAGLRRAEAAALDLADWAPAERALTVRAGKGNKQRRLYLSPVAARRLAAWLARRGAHPGPLFHPVHRSGSIQVGRRLTPQAVRFILGARAEHAGVALFSPHDLRRTWIGELLDAGADLPSVQGLAGHASPATTARYDRRGERARRAAAALVDLPEA